MRRDIAILVALYLYGALTAAQIGKLVFGADDGEVHTPLKRRLRGLHQWGYVIRIEQPSRLSEGRRPLVYLLSKTGAEVVSHELGQAIDWHRKDSTITAPFLEHHLATNDVVISMVRSAEKKGWKILRRLDEKMLKQENMKDRIVLKGERGGKVQAAVVPDFYIRLDAQEDVYNFFAEVDRGTVTGEATEWGRRDWARKVKAYLEYYRSGLYEKRYRTSDMRVLTVTTGETRLANLKRITQEAGGKARFWFTTFERIENKDILTDRIWDVASREEKAALIPTESGTVFEYKPEE